MDHGVELDATDHGVELDAADHGVDLWASRPRPRRTPAILSMPNVCEPRGICILPLQQRWMYPKIRATFLY